MALLILTTVRTSNHREDMNLHLVVRQPTGWDYHYGEQSKLIAWYGAQNTITVWHSLRTQTLGSVVGERRERQQTQNGPNWSRTPHRLHGTPGS
jgi:hypothetical protein